VQPGPVEREIVAARLDPSVAASEKRELKTDTGTDTDVMR
jgi:hypothetical protein